MSIRTVRGVGYQQTSSSAQLLRLGAVVVDVGTGRLSTDPGRPLSQRERQVLAALATGLPMGREALERKVWGRVPFRRSRRPDAVIHRLRKRLEPDPTRPVHLITTPLGWMLQWPRETEPALVGRDAEVAEVVSALTARRSLAVVGPPGIGTSSVASAAFRAFGDGLWIPTADSLPAWRANLDRAIGRPPSESDETLLRSVPGRPLFLDAPPASAMALVQALATQTPVVVTGQEAPAGFVVLRLRPLSVADARALYARHSRDAPSFGRSGSDLSPQLVLLAALHSEDPVSVALDGARDLLSRSWRRLSHPARRAAQQAAVYRSVLPAGLPCLEELVAQSWVHAGVEGARLPAVVAAWLKPLPPSAVEAADEELSERLAALARRVRGSDGAAAVRELVRDQDDVLATLERGGPGAERALTLLSRHNVLHQSYLLELGQQALARGLPVSSTTARLLIGAHRLDEAQEVLAGMPPGPETDRVWCHLAGTQRDAGALRAYLGERPSDSHDECDWLRDRINLALGESDQRGFETYLAELRLLAVTLGDRFADKECASLGAAGYRRWGMWAHAHAEASRLVVLVEEMGLPGTAPYAHFWRATAALRLGDLADARRGLVATGELAIRHDHAAMWIVAETWLALLALVEGQPVDAWEHCSRARYREQRIGLPPTFAVDLDLVEAAVCRARGWEPTEARGRSPVMEEMLAALLA